MTKKGKTLMMFVSVDGEPDRDETERLTTLWHGSLFNNHIQCDRWGRSTITYSATGGRDAERGGK